MIYRPEIAGLRSIAVLSVIFYHAKFLAFEQIWFQGGYIGVDVFLVISGYLITKIILAEFFEKKTFSFRNFYERRTRRILPVLLDEYQGLCELCGTLNRVFALQTTRAVWWWELWCEGICR